MKADFIPTVTRKQGSLTFAMKKRPTSGDVTHIRTLHDDVDVSSVKFQGCDGTCSPERDFSRMLVCKSET